MLILIVENDAPMREALELMLKASGHQVQSAEFAEDALSFAKDYELDAIILDNPNLVKAIRGGGKNGVPIMIVSTDVGVEDKVRGLNAGADDYLAKPFHKDELMARLVAIVRRSCGKASSVITAGELAIDLAEHTVAMSGVELHLTGNEYKIMEFLAMRKGRVVTKQQFIDRLYNGRDDPEIKIIDVTICNLRKKLAKGSDSLNFIETKWGVGYSLKDPASCAPIQYRHPHGTSRASIEAGKAQAGGI